MMVTKTTFINVKKINNILPEQESIILINPLFAVAATGVKNKYWKCILKM